MGSTLSTTGHPGEKGSFAENPGNSRLPHRSQGTSVATALVTGARGFIGRRLVRALLDRRVRVVCLDRTPAGRDALSDMDVQRVVGDVQDRQSMRQLTSDADYVFHLAAATSPRSLAQSRAVNVTGTRNLVQAASEQSKPPVFVYVSSLAAVGPADTAVTETSPCHPVSAYGRAKLEAEQVLARFADRLPVTIVRPPCVFGPGDRNLLSLYKIVRRGWNFHTGGGSAYSFLYVDDLITGLLKAAEAGRRLSPAPNADKQGIYFLADPESVTLPQLAEMIAACWNQDRVRHIRIPRPVASVAALIGEAAVALTGRKVYLNLDKLREAYGGSWICDASRAARDLAFAPTARLAQRLAETKRSFEADGWL